MTKVKKTPSRLKGVFVTLSTPLPPLPPDHTWVERLLIHRVEVDHDVGMREFGNVHLELFQLLLHAHLPVQ